MDLEKAKKEKKSEITSISFLQKSSIPRFSQILYNFKCLHLFPSHKLLTFKTLTSTKL